MKKIIEPIEITLTLHRKQCKGLNKWEVTIQGETRICTHEKVKFYAMPLEEVATAFNPNEVREFSINWLNPHRHITQEEVM